MAEPDPAVAEPDPAVAEPDPDVADLVRRLRARGETVAVAESLTGGLLAATLVDVPGVSAVFRGGLVVYATDLKCTLAGVPADLLARLGPVDADVAAALAGGARERCGADWGLATTGVAGPDPQDGKPAGTVFVACASPRGTVVDGLSLSGDRPAIRRAAVAAALRLLADGLLADGLPVDRQAVDRLPADRPSAEDRLDPVVPGEDPGTASNPRTVSSRHDNPDRRTPA